MSVKDDFFDQVHQTFPDKAVEVTDPLKEKYIPQPSMKVVSATFSLSYIVPKGQYENVKPMLSITFEGDRIDFREGWDKVEMELKKEVSKLQYAIAKHEQSAPSTPEQTQELCPKDKGILVEGETKGGKKYVKCSNNQWDRNLKKAVGCDYIKWS